MTELENIIQQFPEGDIFYDIRQKDYVVIMGWQAKTEYRTTYYLAEVFYIKENKRYNPHLEYIVSKLKRF